ncbi:GIN domain-containing protein [Pedobacter nyackensis]|uniref:Putative auto-transporter adhesin head GIN domain-containing protein n=1 Tax=Pedobacter nyackensis TaxID=475255 RepID=A0A1W2E5D9_9SPHI|nr:DUF2807 domain-containing protein [Pedobacter nyackensis]SMD04632.1 hypothetical protein SAMN04488101_1103 [Pedobacter nyackensis]
MKTSVKTLFASALTAIFLSTAFASVAADKNTNPSAISVGIDFNKVILTGNAKVELVQSNKPRVVIYEQYNKERTSIVQKGDKLYINSNEEQPINIVVYVKDLVRIDASQKVSVTTRGKFLSNAMQVFVKDHAKAFVNGDISSLYTVIDDYAVLRLKGSSKDHTLAKGRVARLKMDQFVALKTTNTSLDDAILTGYSIVIPKDTVIADVAETLMK